MSEKSKYERLEDTWLKERTSPKLMPLERDFFQEMRSWIEGLRREADSANEALKRALMAEADVSEEMLSSLRAMRAVKALSMVLAGERVEGLTEDEMELLKAAARQELPRRPAKREPKKPIEGPSRILVTFKKLVPAFVGVDLAIYGPFSEGDVANIPEENASMLVEKGLAQVLHEDEGAEQH